MTEEPGALPDADAVEAAIGSPWLADLDGEPMELELVSVERLPVRDGRVGYVLDLRQTAGTPLLGQRVLPLEHEQLGRHELFVVPQAPRATGEHWYAVTIT